MISSLLLYISHNVSRLFFLECNRKSMWLCPMSQHIMYTYMVSCQNDIVLFIGPKKKLCFAVKAKKSTFFWNFKTKTMFVLTLTLLCTLFPFLANCGYHVRIMLSLWHHYIFSYFKYTYILHRFGDNRQKAHYYYIY